MLCHLSPGQSGDGILGRSTISDGNWSPFFGSDFTQSYISMTTRWAATRYTWAFWTPIYGRVVTGVTPVIHVKGHLIYRGYNLAHLEEMLSPGWWLNQPNPFEKILRTSKWKSSFPNFRDENEKNIWVATNPDMCNSLRQFRYMAMERGTNHLRSQP